MLGKRGHIAVKGHITGKDSNIILLNDMLYLEERITHLNTEGLSLIASRYSTPVVVRQNNDRLAIQVRAENPLA